MRRLLPLAILVAACDTRPGLPGGDPTPEDDRATLRIGLVDEDGQPLDDAVVTLLPSGRDAETGPDGIARFARVPLGEYDVQAAAPGHVTRVDRIEVKGELDVTLDLLDRPVGASLRGTVRDATGAPLEDATVLVAGVPVATTLDDGSFAAIDLPDGPQDVRVEPPPNTGWLPYALGRVDLVAAGRVKVGVTLGGAPPDEASFIGSEPCGICHSDAGDAWRDSAHAQSVHTPLELEGHPSGIDDAFVQGTWVPLGTDLVSVGSSASARLGRDGPGQWWVQIDLLEPPGLSTSTDRLPVVEVYGALRHGAALAVELEGQRVLAPVVWAAPGGGLGSTQPDGAWLGPDEGVSRTHFFGAWQSGWFDNGRLDPDPTSPDLSFDLRCAGCHTTGYRIDEDSDGWSLATATGQPEPVEAGVGCEACHGPGSVHRRRGGSLDGRRETILNPGRLPPSERLEVCATCHERASAIDHPFSERPSPPVGPDGAPKAPWEPLSDLAVPDPEWFIGADVSRLLADQVGELRSSPHRRGTHGYTGGCVDCHDPHGSAQPASLHADTWDNALCDTCHTALADDAVLADHMAHDTLSVGPWEPGACVGCHMPRAATVVRPDVTSFVGEARSHHLRPVRPDQVLATFDAADADVVDPHDVPSGSCLDCHAQRQQAALDAGEGGCPCPQGDPGQRRTWDSLQVIFDRMFPGATP